VPLALTKMTLTGAILGALAVILSHTALSFVTPVKFDSVSRVARAA
jgi:hypothetical protein